MSAAAPDLAGPGTRTTVPPSGGSIIAIVPVVMLFALMEKHLVGGLTSGAVK